MELHTEAMLTAPALFIQKKHSDDLVVALAGNPNVGKSTVFNNLTGLHQHTGNWPGKTVANAQGYFEHDGVGVILVDVPGCYSLMAHSAEEEVARDFICFGHADRTVVVCDATCLERSLSLVLQTIEISGRCIVCVNLMDEAKQRGIRVDTDRLQVLLGVPVIGCAARSGKGLDSLTVAITTPMPASDLQIVYPAYMEEVIRILTPSITDLCSENGINPRWLALRLMDADTSLSESLRRTFGARLETAEIADAIRQADTYLALNGIGRTEFSDAAAAATVAQAEELAAAAVCKKQGRCDSRDRRIDRILTGKRTAFPIMLLLLAFIFWITINGANYPSALLSQGFNALEEKLLTLAQSVGLPPPLREALIHGVYRVLSWVVAVMLPPMAIFFPLFTLLEDAGFLPRIAFNLDRAFSRCRACGKQSLTMCMGFGCNAAGIIGCRIIDSPRERLIAILTNVFVPCNGRFPGLITIISIFFVFRISGVLSGIVSALVLTLIILTGIFATLLCSRLLSATVLKGIPSSFTLEMPPYRRPQIGKVIVRSIFDRTLFVLSRAVAIAAPAGLVIWLLANLRIQDITLLQYCTDFLDSFARFFGLDGVILTAFLLGFPANEIVLPLMLMTYMANGTLTEIGNISLMQSIFSANGWTILTAVNVMLFSLMHFPCSTTLITIRKETGSAKWTVLAFFLPTAIGLLACLITTTIARLFGAY